jgi:DNA processing protein
VIGTPLGKYYPPANKQLQDRIAREFLLISQVPVLRYREQDYRLNRFFFRSEMSP